MWLLDHNIPHRVREVLEKENGALVKVVVDFEEAWKKTPIKPVAGKLIEWP